MKIILIRPAESGTTNRRLLDRKAFFDFKKPFDLTLEYISSYDKKFFAQKDLKNPSFSSENTSNPTWSGRADLNRRPLAPEASALANCATPRTKSKLVFLKDTYRFGTGHGPAFQILIYLQVIFFFSSSESAASNLSSNLSKLFTALS